MPFALPNIDFVRVIKFTDAVDCLVIVRTIHGLLAMKRAIRCEQVDAIPCHELERCKRFPHDDKIA